jgi:thiamine monophosphate synthase
MSVNEKKAGAPACGLWIRLGPDLALQELMRDLKQIYFVINGSSYEKNMHVLEVCCDESHGEETGKAALLFAQARENGIATILRGSIDKAKELEADGVLVDDIGKIKSAKQTFGEQGIIGFSCGLSDEQAAAAYDAGVDFVTFGTGKRTMPEPRALKFWTMLTDLPAVIEGDITNDYAAYYVQQGAAFLDCKDYIWGHKKGVMQGTVNMLHAIEVALEEDKKAVQ